MNPNIFDDMPTPTAGNPSLNMEPGPVWGDGHGPMSAGPEQQFVCDTPRPRIVGEEGEMGFLDLLNDDDDACLDANFGGVTLPQGEPPCETAGQDGRREGEDAEERSGSPTPGRMELLEESGLPGEAPGRSPGGSSVGSSDGLPMRMLRILCPSLIPVQTSTPEEEAEKAGMRKVGKGYNS